MPKQEFNWLPVWISVAGLVGSLVVSTLIAGMYIGQVKTSLENTIKTQENDRVEFKQRVAILTDTVNSLNVNLTGVTVGLKGLSEALTMERQDRLNTEIRRASAR